MLTKSTTVLVASGTNAAAATSSSSWQNAQTYYAGTVIAQCINGATGPGSGCRFRVQLSPDNGGTIYDYSSEVASTSNLTTTYYQPVTLPIDTLYFRSVFDQNTNQNVTVLANSEQITGV